MGSYNYDTVISNLAYECEVDIFWSYSLKICLSDPDGIIYIGYIIYINFYL